MQRGISIFGFWSRLYLGLALMLVSDSAARAQWVLPHVRHLKKTITVTKERIAGNDPRLGLQLASIYRRQIISGTYRICIDTNGEIRTIDPVFGIKYADETIMSQLQGWRYKPILIPLCYEQVLEYQVEPAELGLLSQSPEQDFHNLYKQCRKELEAESPKALKPCGEASRLAVSIYGKNSDAAGRMFTLRAAAYSFSGNYWQAIASAEEALNLLEKQLGPLHPEVAKLLGNIISLEISRKPPERVVPDLRRLHKLRELELTRAASASHVADLLDGNRWEEEALYSLLRPGQTAPDLHAAALTLSLLRKGRAADIAAQAGRAVLESLTSHEQRARFEQWKSLRTQREQLYLSDPAHLSQNVFEKEILSLSSRIYSLEQELASASPVLRELRAPRWEETIPRVAQKLPADGVLIEVIWTREFQPQSVGTRLKWEAPHYLAMILFPDKRIEVVELGAAAVVDEAVAKLLAQLKSPSSDPLPAAQALYRMIFKPLETVATGISQLYLSLDGSLNLIPFAALHDGKQYLLDRYQLHYLTSGRDLLRDTAKSSAQPALVLADPEFSQSTAATTVAANRPIDDVTRSLYSNLKALRQLPGTLKEAEILAQLLPDAMVLTGREATEQALRSAQAPRILHIATHGMFLEEEPAKDEPETGTIRGLIPLSSQARSETITVEVLDQRPTDGIGRSALILAGAAQADRSATVDRDGVVTDEDVRTMNLWGTELAVLSACDTGRGAVQAGQGVYGLRRAFFVAGAETLITSLWQVADLETGDLMKSYYEKLLKEGKPRLGAMQEAMQEMRKRRPHPYFWAPFIVIGRDAPLSSVTK